jgi:hypothetical protein
MGWAGHIARVGADVFNVLVLKGKDYLKDIDIDERILKWALNI